MHGAEYSNQLQTMSKELFLQTFTGAFTCLPHSYFKHKHTRTHSASLCFTYKILYWEIFSRDVRLVDIPMIKYSRMPSLLLATSETSGTTNQTLYTA